MACRWLDKLKPYGIAIHGCIDGLVWNSYVQLFNNFQNSYSRKIMWLNAASSNNDPRVIGSYFMECVISIGGKSHSILLLNPLTPIDVDLRSCTRGVVR